MNSTDVAQALEFLPQYLFEKLTPDNVTDEDLENLKPLFAELTSGAKQAISREDLMNALYQQKNRLGHSEFHMEVARGPKPEKTIVAMATVHLHAKRPLDRIAYVDDVVTHPSHQGRGLARMLMIRLIHQAQTIWKATCVDLTSNPQRIAANGLYRSMGFRLLDAVILRRETKKDGSPPEWRFLGRQYVHDIKTLMGSKLFVDMVSFEALLDHALACDNLPATLIRTGRAYGSGQINTINITVPTRLLTECQKFLTSGFVVRETNVYRLPLPVKLDTLAPPNLESPNFPA